MAHTRRSVAFRSSAFGRMMLLGDTWYPLATPCYGRAWPWHDAQLTIPHVRNRWRE